MCASQPPYEYAPDPIPTQAPEPVQAPEEKLAPPLHAWAQTVLHVTVPKFVQALDPVRAQTPEAARADAPELPEEFLIVHAPPCTPKQANALMQEQPIEEFSQLITELRVRLDHEKRRMEQLGDVFRMRSEYDRENEELATNPYPEFEKVEEQFNTWAGKIQIKQEAAKELIKAVSEITPLMTQLDGNTLSSEVLYKIRFVHRKASLDIERNHNEMLTRQTELERDLANIQLTARKALEELKHIKQHPHFRRSQIIGRISRGERPGKFSNLTDRTTRHAFAASAMAYDYYASIIGSRQKN
jgi:uncharacterized coiled-coil protein SlyX